MKKNIFIFVFMLCFLIPNVSMATEENVGCSHIVPCYELTEIEGVYFRNTDGLFKCAYYKTGELRFEQPLRHGKVHGISREYDKKGRIVCTVPFVNGMVEGIQKNYYENGSLSFETPLKNNKREGQQKVYRKNGKLFATIVYKNNSPISGMCHNSDGSTTHLTNAELSNWENGLNIECN